ncbi:protein AUXIN SIGNALING F-BOX 3-like [Iris pallida]|uniref:Protein AUXIN SIGNALING F-BOX 3-like n=1 Tax=Iris pallida TaxID=29817 RepID=A0AAX6F3G7_IRIPA|nr:protein AUXIN SIGNALING F-BOX 3-like [Iris pallida]
MMKWIESWKKWPDLGGEPEISSISMGFSSVSVPYPPDPYGYSSPPQQYETPSYSPLPPPSPPDYSQPTPPPPDYYGYPQTPLSQPYQYLQQSYQYQYSQQQYPMPSPPTVPDYGYPLVMTTPFSVQYAAQSSLSTWNYQQDTAHSPLSIHSLLYSQCQYQSDLLRPYSELEVLNEMPVKEEARESLNCEVLLFDEMNEKDSKTSDDALVTTTVVEPIDVVVIGSTTSECLSVENEVAEKTNVESVTPTDERSVQLENEATYVGEDTASVSTEKGVGSKDGALCEYPKELVKEVTRPIDGEQSELRYESDGTTNQSEPKPFNSSQLDEPISTGFVCKDAKLKTIDCELQIEVSVQIVATDKGVADHVEGKVVVSYHVADFSCCLVTGEYDWTANTERIMKAQVLRDSNMADYMTSKKTMEVNPENSIMDELRKRVDAVKNDKSVKDLVVLLFETVLLTFGFNLDDPNTFGNWMLKWGLSIDEDDTPKELFAIDSSDMSASLEKKLELIEFMAFSTRYKVSVLQSQTADRIWDPGSNKMALQVVCGTGLKFSRDHVCPVDELSFDFGSSWLSGSPESLTSLEVPNFANINLDVNFDALERLVARCKSLKVLKVNKNVSLEQLQVLLVRVPQFAEIGTGTGSFIKDHMVSVLYSACSHFSFLNLGYVPMQSTEPAKFLSHGPLLRRLWVLDKVEEKGLKAMGFSCPLLEELQIFPANPFDDEVLDGEDNGVTEIGFVAISEVCPNFHYVLYFCRHVTNATCEKIKNLAKAKELDSCLILLINGAWAATKESTRRGSLGAL